MRNVVWSYCGTVLTLGSFIACGGPASQDLFSAGPEDGGARSTPTPAAGTPGRGATGSSVETTLTGAGGTSIASGDGGSVGIADAGGNTAGVPFGGSSGGGSAGAGPGTSGGRGGAPSASGGRAPATGGAGEGGLSGDGGAETLGGSAGLAESAGAGGSGAVQTGGSPAYLGGAGGANGGTPGTCEPTAEVCDGLDNDCNGAADERNRCPAGCSGFSLGGDHGYMYCGDGVTHDQAMQRCERQGMHLVTIQSAAENQAVLDAVFSVAAGAPPSSVRIGATHTGEGAWSWVDGTVFWADGRPANGAYVNWDSGEPNDSIAEGGEDCGTMLVAALASDAGLWNDVSCSVQLAFVCEAE